jgi:hypothetical protein
VLLDALGYAPDVGTIGLETAVWTSRRDGQLGIGRRVLVNQLTPGEHHQAPRFWSATGLVNSPARSRPS